MSCSHVKSCELFVQFALNPALDIWKEHYCHGDYSVCERFNRSKAGQPVPLTLLPNGRLVKAKIEKVNYGSTAIYNAIIKKRTRMVCSLLKVGIDINTKNLQGITPLMAAVEENTPDIVEVLVEHGADLTLVNVDGETAYEIAVRLGYHDIAKTLNPEHDEQGVALANAG